jgi:hypothetical protein
MNDLRDRLAEAFEYLGPDANQAVDAAMEAIGEGE